MSPSRGVRWCALLILVGLLSQVSSGAAQVLLDQPNPLFEGPNDPLARSPRLLGMGRLSYVLDDIHNRINLWDLGGNPVGVVDADTGSTVELTPFTQSNSTVEAPLSDPESVRQFRASRDYRTYYEAWRRTPNSTYGIMGDWDLSRTNAAYDQSLEIRQDLGRPNIVPIVAGRLPIGRSKPFLYAIRAVAANSTANGHFLRFVSNGAGQFIDLDGTEVDPPNFFIPIDTRVRTVGVGTQLGVRVTSRIEAALGYDYVSDDIHSTNTGFRYSSEVRESRPYDIGQVGIVGRSFGSLEWGASARGWRSKSQQTWVFSTSAGTATVPLEGRGNLQKREEEGSNLEARARWTRGALQVAAGYQTSYGKAEVTPPPFDEPGNFNYFLNTVFLRSGADTLALPDSVVHNVVSDRAWQAGGGLGWTWRRTVVGLEGHYFQSRRDQELSGAGPKRIGWDVRSGIEFPALPMLSVRAGYLYSWQDLDDFTRLNEYLTHSATAGFGFHPPATTWVLDVGYEFDWTRADFTSPYVPHAGSQRLSGRVRWAF